MTEKEKIQFKGYTRKLPNNREIFLSVYDENSVLVKFTNEFKVDTVCRMSNEAVEALWGLFQARHDRRHSVWYAERDLETLDPPIQPEP